MALFSNGAVHSRPKRPKVAAAGAIVIDNSSAWRMDPDVPLVVARSTRAPWRRSRRASSPTPTARRWWRCRSWRRCTGPPGCRLIVSTYQAVSGAGLAGVEELDAQVRAVADKATALTFDGRAVAFSRPPSSPRRSRSTCSRSRAATSTTVRARPTRSRSGATRAARSSASRSSPCRARACVCRCSPGIRCRSTWSSHATLSPRGGRAPVRRAGVELPTCRPRSRVPAPTPCSWAASARDPVTEHGPGPVPVRRQPAQGRRPQRGADRRGPPPAPRGRPFRGRHRVPVRTWGTPPRTEPRPPRATTRAGWRATPATPARRRARAAARCDPFPRRLGQLAHLLGEPGDGRGHAAAPSRAP